MKIVMKDNQHPIGDTPTAPCDWCGEEAILSPVSYWADVPSYDAVADYPHICRNCDD